ncbi:hypothetical protein PspLS_10642 [Pyricularia sp. CBS 133598]|nr:hypothetical protein PspLS_10642 [Pyricularia sp. CBS 133598]
MRIVSPDTPSVLATEYSLFCVAQHRLPPGYVLVQGRVGAREEVLLAQGVRLARHVVATHAEGRLLLLLLMRITAAAPAGGGVGIGVLWRRGHKRAAAEQLGPVLGVRCIFAGGLEAVELAAEAVQLLAEVADALKGLFLLGRVQLLLGEGVVLVHGAREGGERGGEGAEGGGRRVRDVSEVAADVGALLERRVEGCVLAGEREESVDCVFLVDKNLGGAFPPPDTERQEDIGHGTVRQRPLGVFQYLCAKHSGDHVAALLVQAHHVLDGGVLPSQGLLDPLNSMLYRHVVRVVQRRGEGEVVDEVRIALPRWHPTPAVGDEEVGFDLSSQVLEVNHAHTLRPVDYGQDALVVAYLHKSLEREAHGRDGRDGVDDGRARALPSCPTLLNTLLEQRDELVVREGVFERNGAARHVAPRNLDHVLNRLSAGGVDCVEVQDLILLVVIPDQVTQHCVDAYCRVGHKGDGVLVDAQQRRHGRPGPFQELRPVVPDPDVGAFL